METTSASAPKLDPIAIGWVADVLSELETNLASRKPLEDTVERRWLLARLPPLRDAIIGWIRLLQTQASGKNVADSLWKAHRALTNNLPAMPEHSPNRSGATPRVADNSVAGQVVHARTSRAFEPDPFREAVSALGDADSAEVAKLAVAARRNADRAIKSIDACLPVLADESN